MGQFFCNWAKQQRLTLPSCVCPLATRRLGNHEKWQSEMKKVLRASSALRVHQYHGSKRLKDALQLADFDVVRLEPTPLEYFTVLESLPFLTNCQVPN